MSGPADLAYFGRATASISHELKNVVTIINEAAGLLGDLTAAAERGRPLDPARLRKLGEEIGRNVARAVETLNRLNRFAHSVDEPERSVDLGQVLADTLGVAGRYPGLRDLSLELAAPAPAPQVRTFPFGLHRALVLALGLAADADGPPALRAEVLPADDESWVRVRIARGPIHEGEAAARALAELQGELVTLGGRAEFEAPRAAVILVLPRAG